MEIEVDTEDVSLKNIDNIEEYNDLEIIKAETLSIIKAIEDDGIDLSDTYEISHILSAIDFKSLEDCAIEIDALFSGLNYDGPDEFEEDGEPVFEVRLLMDSKIDIDEIYPAIIKIVECCNKHNVAYDGWGVNFLDEDE